MLLIVYFVVGVVNIVAKRNNYYVQTPRNPDFDVRVKRQALGINNSIDFKELKSKANEESVILKKLNEGSKFYQEENLNEDILDEKIIEIKDIGKRDPIFEYVIKNDEGKVKLNNIYVPKDEQDDTSALQNYDETNTLKILKAFDDVDDLLGIYILESNTEDEKIMNENDVIKHTESGQLFEFAVDYSDELNDNLKKSKKRNKQNERNYNFNKGMRVRRDASPKNSVSRFFTNIYDKVYDMTHPKKEIINNNLLLSDENYKSYDNVYQQNHINNNQHASKNQYEYNRINDNSLTHSDYMYSNNDGYNNHIYNPSTNINNYVYNTSSNGYSTNNAPAYNYNNYYASGYGYNRAVNNGYPYNGYNNNPYNAYNTPIHGNDLNNNPTNFTYNYGNAYGNNIPSDHNSYSNTPKQDNGNSYDGYNYNATQNYGFGYNASKVENSLNNNDAATEETIVEGCVFCSNLRCQKNYRWVGVACVPKG